MLANIILPATGTYWLVLLLLFFGICLLESVALRAMRWGSWRRCALDALVINVASTLVGFAWVALGTRWPFTPSWFPSWFVLGLVLSVLLEAGLLWLMRRSMRSFRSAINSVFIANLASYGFLSVFLILVPF